MSERRIVKRDHVREMLQTASLDDGTCVLLAMTIDQVEILRVVARYASRRINWVDKDIDSHRYYLPDDADWDDIQALVDDMEHRLMDTCSLQELIDAIEGLCTCLPMAQRMLPGPLSSTALQDGLDDGSITYQEPVPDLESDEDACASAQTLYYMVYEYISEIAIPVANWSFELVVPVALAYLASIGVVIKVLMWLGLTMEFVQETISAIFDVNGEATLNWLLAAKDELICAFYNYFKTGSAVDWAEVTSLVNAGDAPITVKPFLKTAYRLLRKTAQLFHGTAWALLRLQEGACDACDQPAGCYDFCDPDWTIVPEYATLDEEGCFITMQGAVTNYVGAYRTISGIGLATVTLDLNPPDYAPPAFNCLIVRLWDVDDNFESQTIEVTDNGRQEVVLVFTLADPTLLEIRTVAGTATVIYDVCVEETE
jgi:hypothetical protein